MKKMASYFCLGFLASIFLFLTSCKSNNPNSNLSRAETFAAGANARGLNNQCRSNNTTGVALLTDRIVYDGVPQTEAVRTALLNTSSAIPQHLRNLFIESEGIIRVTPNVKQLCGQAFSDDSKSDAHAKLNGIEACWNVTTHPQTNISVAQIIISPKPQAINNYLLRAFGYLYSQYYMKLEASEVALSKLKNPSPSTLSHYRSHAFIRQAADNQRFMGLKERIMNAYLIDLATQPAGSLLQAKNLDYLLGQGGGEKLRENVRLKKPNLLDGITFNAKGNNHPNYLASRRSNLKNFIFAEVLDSQCNSVAPRVGLKGKVATRANLTRAKNTLEILEAFFPRTYDLWFRKLNVDNQLAAYSLGLSTEIRKFKESRRRSGVLALTNTGDAQVSRSRMCLTNPGACAQTAIDAENRELEAEGFGLYSNSQLSTRSVAQIPFNYQMGAGAYRAYLRNMLLVALLGSLGQAFAQNNSVKNAAPKKEDKTPKLERKKKDKKETKNIAEGKKLCENGCCCGDGQCNCNCGGCCGNGCQGAGCQCGCNALT